MKDCADLRKRLDDDARWMEAGGGVFIDQCAKILREAEAAIAALERKRDDLKRDVLEAIESEPEAPGDMPDELRMLPVEDVVRAAIRATKRNIAQRVARLTGETDDR